MILFKITRVNSNFAEIIQNCLIKRQDNLLDKEIQQLKFFKNFINKRICPEEIEELMMMHPKEN